MKKIILLALIASSAVFAFEAADKMKEAGTQEVRGEVRAAVEHAVDSESNASEEAAEKAAEKEAM